MNIIIDFIEQWLEQDIFDCIIEIGGTALFVVLLWLLYLIACVL